MANFPRPSEGIALTHFVVRSDVACSRRFYADVLGGEVLLEPPWLVTYQRSLFGGLVVASSSPATEGLFNAKAP